MGSINGEEAGNGGSGGGKEETIYVSVRVRPLNCKEIEKNEHSDWEVINNTTIIFKNSLPDRSMLPSAYTYDRVFGYDCDTRKVYEEGAKEVALSVVSGINSSIFAYGQTSSGKTYTMIGITEYFMEDIYEYIEKHKEREFFLKFSAMEIYNEACRDLLSSDSTPLRLLDDPERGTVVEKLTEETLRDKSHLKELLAICEAQRQVGETSLNEASSRSHQIIRLTIESTSRQFHASSLSASVNFVDLAGSERASQTLSAGTRLKEGSHINRSLLTLGTVIRKLSKGRNGHVPYRDSKLTRILQNSLGGNARTAIICTMSPARSHIEQSRNTLLFASCAKEVATSARVNVVMSDKSLVKHLQRELARLEDELRYVSLVHKTTRTDELNEKDAQIMKMGKEIRELIEQRDLAQSRLTNLIGCVGDYNDSRQLDSERFSILHARNPSEDSHFLRHWEESSQFSGQLGFNGHAFSQWEESSQLSVYRAGTSEDESSVSEASGICYQSPEFGISKCKISNLTNVNDANQQQSVIARVSEITVASARHNPQIMHQAREVASETSEDNCKVVQCIEINDWSSNKDESYHLLGKNCENLPTRICANSNIDHERSFKTYSGFGLALDHQVRVRQASEDFLKPIIDESFHNESPVSESNNTSLETFKKESMPPYSSVKDFLRVPENELIGNSFLISGTDSEKTLEALQESENSSDEELKIPCAKISDKLLDMQCTGVYEDKLIARHSKTASEVFIPSISNFMEGLKEMAQVQYNEQSTKYQELHHTPNRNCEVEKSMNDALTDTLSSTSDSPYQWSLAFEKLQREMLELWDVCNVSLIHRTYFFLLFKGEPADSIYMEVEHRRLSFLKKMLSQDNETETRSSSLKKLRRERDMLQKRMLKKISASERDKLYRKWGIELNSKKRRMQLAHRLWTDTKNVEHVRQSALLVAKLVGLLEPEQALKEMFGLSFTPQKAHRRSSSWKHLPSFR